MHQSAELLDPVKQSSEINLVTSEPISVTEQNLDKPAESQRLDKQPAVLRSAKTLMPSYGVSTLLWLLMLAITSISAYFAEQPSLSMTLIGVILLLTSIKAVMIGGKIIHGKI